MDRKKFIRSALLGFTGTALGKSKILKKHSDYDRMMAQVGFNHLPNKEIRTMKTVLHKANTRGHANHGWLDTHHTFSFSTYMNRERMNFGVLRVLNDDIVAGGMGFGTHPHDNMEIVSIPLEGDLEHKDSMGNTTVIRQGDVQVMSAGTGVYHSEYNKNKDKPVKFLQIWMFPNKRDVAPRYDQISLETSKHHNQMRQILSPNENDEGVWVHQNAWFYLGEFEEGQKARYNLKQVGNGLYIFVLKGEVIIGDQLLEQRDGYGMWDMDGVNIYAKGNTEILLMEVPMTLN